MNIDFNLGVIVFGCGFLLLVGIAALISQRFGGDSDAE